MGTAAAFLPSALAILLLLAGVVNDLRERKVRNQLVLVGFVLGLVCILALQGTSGLITSLLSLLTAGVAILPLYILRVFGGGDVKLFLAVSVLMGWKAVLISLFGAIVWGAVLGILQVVLQGKGKAFAHNMLALAHSRSKLPETQVHKIPFTVALFFGYLTNLVVGGIL